MSWSSSEAAPDQTTCPTWRSITRSATPTMPCGLSRNEQHGRSPFTQLDEDPEDLLHDPRREPEGRLVGDQQFGTEHEHRREREHLLLPSREAAGVLATPLSEHGEALVQLVTLGRPREHETKVVLDGQARKDARVLRARA